MSARIREHIRSNVVGYIALFGFAISGTATALEGSGAVKHDDLADHVVHRDNIHNAAVSNEKIAPDAIGSGKVFDESLTGADINANTITGADIADESVSWPELGPNSVGASELAEPSVNSDQVVDNGLSGADIDEEALTPLDGHEFFNHKCDPTGTAWHNCTGSGLQFTLARPMEIFVIWDYSVGSRNPDEVPNGQCRTLLDGSEHRRTPIISMDGDKEGMVGGPPVLDMIHLQAGTHTLGFQCYEGLGTDLEVNHLNIEVIELGFDAGTN